MQNKDIFWLGKSENVAQIACWGRGNLGHAQNKRCFFSARALLIYEKTILNLNGK